MCPTATRPPSRYCLGQLAHQMDIHLIRRIARIEMHVDVRIEFARQVEHTMDLSGMVGIVVRRRADDARAALQSFHQQRVGTRIVGQSFLREHAHLDVDRPGVVAPQRLDRLEAAHLHAAVQLEMRAHARGAVLDALLQGTAGAFVHVLDGERLFHRRDTLHGTCLAPLLRCAAVDDVGLVQMDVGLDQTAAGQAAARVEYRPFRLYRRLDRDNASARHADIHRRCIRRMRQPGIADDQIHRLPLPRRCDAGATVEVAQSPILTPTLVARLPTVIAGEAKQSRAWVRSKLTLDMLPNAMGRGRRWQAFFRVCLNPDAAKYN